MNTAALSHLARTASVFYLSTVGGVSLGGTATRKQEGWGGGGARWGDLLRRLPRRREGDRTEWRFSSPAWLFHYVAAGREGWAASWWRPLRKALSKRGRDARLSSEEEGMHGASPSRGGNAAQRRNERRCISCEMQAASVACPGVLVNGEEGESGAVLPHH